MGEMLDMFDKEIERLKKIRDKAVIKPERDPGEDDE